MRRRSTWQRVDGVLLLDKPVGLTSNVALQRARRALNAAKAGHTGTLDPLASGLLPVCFGEATKFAQGLLDARKEYLATVHFGTATRTGDAEGDVIAEAPVTFDATTLAAVLQRFMGATEQVPPRYAALKHEGRNYYEYAREGIEIPRVARPIVIDRLELTRYVPPVALLHVGCSKGTYVRTLAEDIGHALGTVAHLAGLRRLAVGSFRIEDAVTLEALEAIAEDARGARLLPIDAALASLPAVNLDAATSAALLHGQLVVHAGRATGRLRAYGPAGEFLGVVEAAPPELRPVRLVDQAAPRPPPATA